MENSKSISVFLLVIAWDVLLLRISWRERECGLLSACVVTRHGQYDCQVYPFLNGKWCEFDCNLWNPEWKVDGWPVGCWRKTNDSCALVFCNDAAETTWMFLYSILLHLYALVVLCRLYSSKKNSSVLLTT